MDETRAPRVIAFYLPQFHRIPENDAFWEPGFTEWTNVTAARPLYPGHDQPKIPGELGYYDLCDPETREAQARLAREHGIAGFLYWHYWFGGQRVLERPFNEVVEGGKPELPFCLGWANESWTGIWHGAPDRVLIEQTYPGRADFEAHFESLLPALRDPRYIRVDGLPIFSVYRPKDLPDPKEFCELWRELAARAGLPGLHLIGFGTRRWDASRHGFDAFVMEGPKFNKLRRRREGWRSLLRRRSSPDVYSYRDFVLRGFADVRSPLDYPVALSNWDNTPRTRERGVVLEGSSPDLFRQHLREALARVKHRSADRRIVFLKSWNEWAEGNYIEPDQRFGTVYLDVVRDEVARAELRR